MIETGGKAPSSRANKPMGRVLNPSEKFMQW